ncbi:MAG: hypothetical protein M5U12_15635 [Verrucomicrobia bacterium]|nr:hypothetical protein [Verrucomicrobiota bacterium]
MRGAGLITLPQLAGGVAKELADLAVLLAGLGGFRDLVLELLELLGERSPAFN